MLVAETDQLVMTQLKNLCLHRLCVLLSLMDVEPSTVSRDAFFNARGLNFEIAPVCNTALSQRHNQYECSRLPRIAMSLASKQCRGFPKHMVLLRDHA